jgi:antitoxin component YwqK of YwqJK toxin-antitoxin module
MKNLTIATLLVCFAQLAIANNGTTPNGEGVVVTSIVKEVEKSAGKVTYKCGDLPCEGYKETFYDNGQLKISGTFDNGIAVDTLKEYQANGQLLFVKAPSIKDGFEKEFYGNGIVKRFADNVAKTCTYYHPSGQLQLSYIYEEGRRKEIKQYYEDGQLRLAQNGDEQLVYHTNGKVAFKCTRTETNKMNRVLGKNDFYLYDYTFTTYDENGAEILKGSFAGSDAEYTNGFPLCLKEVKKSDLNLM